MRPSVELLRERKRWRSRDVSYFAGPWSGLAELVPRFEASEFRDGQGLPANPHMRCVVRLPRNITEQRIPVGVVSNTYGLAQHHDVADACFEGIRRSGIETRELRCEVGLTELGEWMNLRVYFPREFDAGGAGDRLQLRLECFNSVDGSCRLVVLLGWLRFVCSNGMVIGETMTELRALHDARLDLASIPDIIGSSMDEVASDESRMRAWVTTPVAAGSLARWADSELAAKWGKKAAARVYHICTTGCDAEFDDPFARGEATQKPVTPAARVPGSPSLARNLFDVGQALAWIATDRVNPEERLRWQSDVPGLLSRLAGRAAQP